MLAHLAGDTGQDDMGAVVELHFEKSIRLFINDRAFGGNQIIFCQLESPSDVVINPHNDWPGFSPARWEPFFSWRA